MATIFCWWQQLCLMTVCCLWWTSLSTAAVTETRYGNFASCADILQASIQQNEAMPTDGEYIISLSQHNTAISIFCAGFSTGSPLEYLILVNGRSTNYAEIYEARGDKDMCQAMEPHQIYSGGGRTEYYRLRINLGQQTVDLSDTRFAVNVSGVSIRYATAGDYYSKTADCGPMGKFSVDLRGTPFAISSDVSWHWDGQYADGSSNGQAVIQNNAYIGCFEDANDRLLPTKLAINSSQFSPDTCIQACVSAGFRFAGVENGRECYCGDTYSKHGRAAQDSECNTLCAGDKSRTCGGTWRLSAYATDKGQTVAGKCGGFPATCYPVVGTQSGQAVLKLVLDPKQPCLRDGTCGLNQLCVSLSAESFKCVEVCNKMFCDTTQHPVTSDTVDCPMGLLPIQCSCTTNICTGARFDHERCLVSTGKPRVTCINENPGHIVLSDRQGKGTVTCAGNNTALIGCSYWDQSGNYQGNGSGVMITNTCSAPGCPACTMYARCQTYICGCENGACNPITGQCICPEGYYGDRCQFFDYCGFYEDHSDDKSQACTAGTCLAVPATDIRTFGVGQNNNTCIFPFSVSLTSMSSVTYTQCVDDNLVGPPFACGTYFDGVNDYIDLGAWSPGPQYTMAVWVSPAISDSIRRVILGAGQNCRDFGLIMQNGTFIAIYPPPNKNCTANLVGPTYDFNQWYLVAVTNDGTQLSLYVNGIQVQAQVKPYYLPTSEFFRIGNSKSVSGRNFKGYIKSVKIWKRSLELSEIQDSMSTEGLYNSSYQALHDGLVAHYELGQTVNVSCQGVDHEGDDWILLKDEEVSGVHCNVNRMTIGQGVTVHVAPYDGSSGGSFEVYAQDIYIDGYLTGEGTGYRGGQQPAVAGANGLPGESYHLSNTGSIGTNLQVLYYQPHRGGGGGGNGGTATSSGSPGGGGGYGVIGGTAQRNKNSHRGQGGQSYGSPNMEHLYLGSGGGSGGNAADLSHSPKGGAGGSGGGAVGLYARGTVQIRGHVSVAGQDGQGDIRQSTGCAVCPAACGASSLTNCSSNSSSACWDNSGPGGGGSGGSFYIRGNVVDIGFDKVWIQGGAGGLGGAGGCGGNGAKGRIRVDAVIFRGQLPNGAKAIIYNDTTQYQDLSVPGQKLIQYNSQLTYGNEIYRGCFADNSTNRHFAYTLPNNATTQQNMTPQYCINQCRLKGYAFSAVENGHECYCDNAFNTSLLKHENDCKLPCSGDSRQTCGAGSRMQVYGPKSFLPALAFNGALQQCRPWCLTGNIYSPTPSWGYCDMSSAITTSFAIRCQCPAGFQGANCDQPCPDGMWGVNCGKTCICNATNSKSCNSQDGTCDCQPGFQGSTCDLPCSFGRYGYRCTGQCSCASTADCDLVTGQCMCKPGWRGQNCNFPCSNNTYDRNCAKVCQCNHGTCSPVDGTCSCQFGYKLPFCSEECEPSNYGPNCMMICDCHDQSCDSFTGLCNCGPGFIGSRCEKICPHGTYGEDCRQHCQCANGGGCDHIGGECNCGPGWGGEQCNLTCLPFKYGMNCLDTCACIQANSESCDGVTGVCTCKPGYTGSLCNLICPEGYYGANCASRCDCYNNATCNKTSGQCQCGAGFTGDRCQTPCSNSTFGVGCSQTCQQCTSGVCSKDNGTCICTGGNCTTCPPGFHGSLCQQMCQCIHGSCDPQSGNCYCDPGWQNPECGSPCPAGTYGNYCYSKCYCLHGNCNAETGICDCLSGFTGTNCDQLCPVGTFGVKCAGKCVPCGPGSVQEECEPISGNCVCKPGYTGLQCDRPCPKNFFGNNCSQQCSSCNNDGVCNNVDGTCECAPGYNGQHCDDKCDFSHWGVNCANNCTCSGQWTTCDFLTGLCTCKPGFLGVLCQETCPLGKYGLGCYEVCTCPPETAECSPIDGFCLCRPGYQPPDCKPCPVNTYGTNCSLACDCSGHGSCDNRGICNCDPGYMGDNCNHQCEQDQTWGKNCQNQCDCSDQHCDFRDGLCRCDEGKQGQRCDQNCDQDHYGFQCAHECQCKNGATCDHVTGECQCPPGTDGRYCDQSCPVGRYGPGCSVTCPCASYTPCERTSGQCQCLPGFKGPSCNISCPAGWWDVNCTSRCSPGCEAGCFAATGLCESAALMDSGGLSAGQTAGIVFGFIIALIVVGLVVFFIMQRYSGRINECSFFKRGLHRSSSSGGSTLEGTSNPLYLFKNRGNESSVQFKLQKTVASDS